MKHKHGNRILGRRAHHRTALLKNLSSDLLKHRSLITAEAKAKELRRHFERLVTDAKGDLTLHRRRQLLRRLRHRDDLLALREVAVQQAARPGGYLRLTKLPLTRSDAAHMVRVEFVGTPATPTAPPRS